jgi:hypothetical protein
MSRTMMLAAALSAFLVPAVHGDDRWEGGTLNNDDTASATANFLFHGARQTHDLQGPPAPPDADFMIVAEKASHSYEARVGAETLQFSDGTCASCAQFDRVDSAGSVLTSGFPLEGNLGGSAARMLVVRWTASTDAIRYLRARGYSGLATGAGDTYDVEFVDTTVFFPRWNNSNGQRTVVLVQNTAGASVAGVVRFYDPGGSELASQAFSVPVRGLFSLNTVTLPALANQAGAATITHDGGWGGLAAKAVALEPATGFSFDTPGLYLPK